MKLFVVSFVLSIFSAMSVIASPVTKPNVILVLVDDMGYGDIGVNGAELIKTPKIDKLAKEGVNFSNFYASANVCTPSRAGLMTGLYPIRTGLAYGVVGSSDERGLPKNLDNLAKLMKRNGYATKMVGKWHLGNFPEYHPLDYGFDEFYGAPFSNDMSGFSLYQGRDKIDASVDQSQLTKNYTKQAVEFIDKQSTKPFFLFLSHSMPHIPLFASEKFKGRSEAGVYGDVVEEIDWSMGELIAALKSKGVYDNTMIMFTSDNGPFFEGSVGNLKGGKGSTYDGGYRVPLVVSWPASIQASTQVEGLSMNIDLMPTIEEAIGNTNEPIRVDGKSLLPVIAGEKPAHQFLYLFNNEDLIGVRSQQWKYLTQSYYRTSVGDFAKFGVLPGFKGAYELLFNMTRPNGERYSLADRHPDILAQHKKLLTRASAEFDLLRTRPKARTFPE